MSGGYVPSLIAARVTPAHKRAVWDAVAEPARLDLGGIEQATGLSGSIVAEIWAEGSAKGRLRMRDEGPGFRWIERVEAELSNAQA